MALSEDHVIFEGPEFEALMEAAEATAYQENYLEWLAEHNVDADAIVLYDYDDMGPEAYPPPPEELVPTGMAIVPDVDKLVTYYQEAMQEMQLEMGNPLLVVHDHDDMGPAAHPEPSPLHEQRKPKHTKVEHFVARELPRSGEGSPLSLRVAPILLHQDEVYASITNALEKSSVGSAGAIVVLPVRGGEGMAMSITCSLEEVGDAGFNVHVDNIVSTNSHTSEVRVVGNIMFPRAPCIQSVTGIKKTGLVADGVVS